MESLVIFSGTAYAVRTRLLSLLRRDGTSLRLPVLYRLERPGQQSSGPRTSRFLRSIWQVYRYLGFLNYGSAALSTQPRAMLPFPIGEIAARPFNPALSLRPMQMN